MNNEDPPSNKSKSAPAEPEATHDIFFDCPSCGKNMSIDEKAAGLIVNCPGCNGKVQVPHPEGPPAQAPANPDQSEPPNEQIRTLLESLTNSQARFMEISEKYNEVQRRRALLERMRVEDHHLFNEIRQHLEQIRTSCDRVSEIMKDAP